MLDEFIQVTPWREIDEMAGKHGAPSTGDGRTSGRKPKRAECAVRRGGEEGGYDMKATAKIFGLFGMFDKGKKDKT